MLKILARLLRKILPDSVLNLFYFELCSVIGRRFSSSLLLDKNKKNFINLGSSSNIIQGFINVDFFRTPNIDYATDLRFPLKIASHTVDGIFCEHTIEHLTYQQVDCLLGECYRILKPNGIIRIIMPDISLFIKNYSENNQDWFKKWEKMMFLESTDNQRSKRRLKSNIEAISFVTQEYGHISCWDLTTIRIYLTKNKFKKILQTGFKQGSCDKLMIDSNDNARKFVSLYVEAVK